MGAPHRHLRVRHPGSRGPVGAGEAIEAAAARLGEVGIAFEVWDGESLSELLCDLPELVDRFFGREATRLFCAEEAAGRLAGRDQARAMLDGL